MMRSITDFVPAGHQIRSPGLLIFDPAKVTAVEVLDRDTPPRVVIHLDEGAVTSRNSAIQVWFHNCTDGSPPLVYEIARRICEAADTAKKALEPAEALLGFSDLRRTRREFYSVEIEPGENIGGVLTPFGKEGWNVAKLGTRRDGSYLALLQREILDD